MPDLAFPHDMRPFVYDRRHVFVQNMLHMRRSLVKMGLIFFVYMVAVAVFIESWNILDFPMRTFGRVLMITLLVCVVFTAFIMLLTALRLRRDRQMYLTHYIGFDEQALYVVNDLIQSRTLWEHFAACAELSDAFILRGSVMGHIIPKTIWSKEEQDAVREHIRQHVRPTKVWLMRRKRSMDSNE